jgi:hypothetical protein
MHGTNELKRVSDETAGKLVDSKKASYIPKCEYKKAMGKGPSTVAATSEKKAKKQKKGTPTGKNIAEEILAKDK